jgi:hypothetical protein
LHIQQNTERSETQIKNLKAAVPKNHPKLVPPPGKKPQKKPFSGLSLWFQNKLLANNFPETDLKEHKVRQQSNLKKT